MIGSNDRRFGNNPLKFVNDLDVDENIVYFIDSTNMTSMDNPIGLIQEMSQNVPRGRLIRYDESTDMLEVLEDELNFPNGITLTPSKKNLLINEVMTRRIVKFVYLFFGFS